MAPTITRDVLESYLFCKYKAYLKHKGQHGTISAYEALRTATRHEVRGEATKKIIAQHQEHDVLSTIPLTTSALKRGPCFVLDATIEDNHISLSVDGLKKIAGVSKLGNFLYLPILFYEGHHVRKEQRLLLALSNVLLSRYQGTASPHGVIWHGQDSQATRIKLAAEIGTAEQILSDVKKMSSHEEPPPLILNEHCQVCEFRQRCHNQAVQEDNLSLLRGLSEKEIKGYNRNGIFTVTQLAHTFRPRRKGKRARQDTTRRSPALQALAIRDKRIYVLGKPDLPHKPVQVYFDIE